VSIALKHVSEEPLPLRQLRPDLHPRLEQAVGRSLLKDPAQRYASADEFIAALQQAREEITAGTGGSGTSTFVPIAPPPEERDPRGRRWPFVLLALLLLGLAAAAVLLKPFSANQVTVPKVVGKSASRATVVLERDKFNVKTHGVQSSKKPGTVVAQDPAGGTEVDEKSTVDLAISSGPGQQLIPDVRNLPAKQALQALNQAGFNVSQDLQPSLVIQRGLAIKTSPPKDTLVDRGSDVRLLVSSGPPKVTLPSVVGQDEAAATGTLTDLGLKVTRELAFSTVPKGQVISQAPPATTSVDKGSRVTITVSKGPEKVDLPDTVGETKDQARADLRAAGFKVRAVQQESPDQPRGTVLRQSPAGGGQAVKGSTVTIYVAIPPAGSGGTGPGSTTTTPTPPPAPGTP
jgi:serine/threonine-protein kinase